jgi:hypothetical protein
LGYPRSRVAPPRRTGASLPLSSAPTTTLLSSATSDDARAKPGRLGGGGLLLTCQLLKIVEVVPILISSAVMADNDGWSVATGL